MCTHGFAGGLVISAGLCYEALLVCVHIFSSKQEVTGEVPKSQSCNGPSAQTSLPQCNHHSSHASKRIRCWSRGWEQCFELLRERELDDDLSMHAGLREYKSHRIHERLQSHRILSFLLKFCTFSPLFSPLFSPFS